MAPKCGVQTECQRTRGGEPSGDDGGVTAEAAPPGTAALAPVRAVQGGHKHVVSVAPLGGQAHPRAGRPHRMDHHLLALALGHGGLVVHGEVIECLGHQPLGRGLLQALGHQDAAFPVQVQQPHTLTSFCCPKSVAVVFRA